MARLGVLLVFLAGCAQLFGLDETSGGGPPEARLSVTRVSIGASLARAPQDLSALTATYLVPDELEPSGLRRVAARVSEPGTWTAPLEEPAPVLFTLPDFPDAVPRMFDFPHVELATVFTVLEHPNPQPVAPEATLSVNVALDVPYAGEGLQLFSVGTWAVRGLEAPPLGAGAVTPPPFPMSSMSSITGRPPELITPQDGLVALRYSGNQLLGAAELAPFDQAVSDSIEGAMTTVALEDLEFQINPGAAVARYPKARPLVGTPSMAWVLRASPGADYNVDTGPLLNAAGVAPAMDQTPITITASYGNPFLATKSWRSTLLWLTEASRTYTPPSAALPVTLRAGMHERAIAGPGLQLSLPAGLPELIAIDGRSLSVDGAEIPAPSRAVTVTFVPDVAQNTMYQLQLFKLVPNAAGTALQFEQKLGASAIAPRFVLPPELFEPGALYTLRAISVQGGFPALAEGDLTMRTLPLALSYVDSGVFQVTPEAP